MCIKINKILLLLILISSSAFAQERTGLYYEKLEKLRSEGIIFTASGIEPFSEVNIYSSGEIKIKINDTYYYLQTSVRDFDTINNQVFYSGYSDGDSISVVVLRGNCYDEADNIYKYYAGIKVNEPVCELCGSYLIATYNPFIPEDAYKLNDIWVVQSINGKKIIPQTTIEFHLNDETAIGYNKDIELSSDIFITGNSIKFDNFKLISGNESYLNYLRAYSGKKFAYEIKNLKLTLTSEDGVIIKLGKVD